MQYKQKIKDSFNFVFLCKKKKKEILHLQETEKTCLAEPFKTPPNVFCSQEI